MSISKETVHSAQHWFDQGIERISGGRFNLGLGLLDRAIAVFSETNDVKRLTLARHHKMYAYLLDKRPEEAESLFVEVMDGYSFMDDSYGQALSLTHLGECQAVQDHLAGAVRHLNLARIIAETHSLFPVLTYVFQRLGLLFKDRDNHVQALRMFELAEMLSGTQGRQNLFCRYRHQRAEILVELGESGRAFALLEDVQTRLINSKSYQEAINPLSLLRAIYEEMGMQEDLERIMTLMHLCGQHILQEEGGRNLQFSDSPPIGGHS
ncbi:MAG: hypothetical protein OEZ59_08990 [Deltaproteobacteria bacterium]|nr:hypothetical protein [Deltaproteobacteria bacterium]